MAWAVSSGWSPPPALFVFFWVSLSRSFWELFRGDPRGLYLGETLSTSQLVSVPMFACGIWLMWRGRKQAAKPG